MCFATPYGALQDQVVCQAANGCLKGFGKDTDIDGPSLRTSKSGQSDAFDFLARDCLDTRDFCA